MRTINETADMNQRRIILLAHDIRSTHNVGSLLRTAECLGIEKVYLTGYTPYPSCPDDVRLPHIAHKLDRQIQKTALGAEQLVTWEHVNDITLALKRLRDAKFCIVALEQNPSSIDISTWTPSDKIALLLGREVEGIAPSLLTQCDMTIEIPQFGQKESLNVAQAAAIALYHCRCAF